MEVAYILLGWLLGILSPGIINHILNYYKKNTLQRIIVGDLKDLKKRLVLLPFRINSNYGTVDKKLFIWIKEQTQNFEELESDFELKKYLNVFNEEIQNVNEYLKMTFDSNITDINHQIIAEEIDRGNLLISEKAIYIVKKINLAI